MKVKADDIKRVKALGFLHNRDTEDEFNCRVITENGSLTSEELEVIAAAARKYGNGSVAFTSRMTVEMQGVKYEGIDSLLADLGEHGLLTGGTGDKVRPIVACKGGTCVFGQVDSAEIAKKIHDRFFIGYKNVELPHKFKIAVGGCPNNCVKPDLNDLGLIGQNMPEIHEDICRGCGKCAVEANCLMHAPKVVDGKITINRDLCNSCGKCIKKCYFHCLSSKAHGVKILIGGKWGRQGRPGSELSGIYSIDEALDIIEKTILVYRENAFKKERFGDMIERIGHDKIEAMILSNDPIERKEEILASTIKPKEGR